MKPIVFAAVASAVVLAAVTFSGPFAYVVFTRDVYLPLHALAEIASVVVSFSIFAVTWNAADKERDARTLVIATAFLAVAIIDTMHVLSFPGMPDFLTASSTEKGIFYWLSARIWAGLAILAAAFVGQSAHSPVLQRGPLLALNLAIATLSFVAVSFFSEHLPSMYVENVGLTPLKIGLEYLVAVLALAATVIYLRGYLDSGNPSLRLLAMALVVTVFSELSFTLYASAYDTFNLLGHIFKVIAYYFIFRALFVSAVQRPYAELEKLYDQIDNQLKRTISELKTHAAELDAANKELEAFSYSISHDLRAPLRAIDGFSRAVLEDSADKLDARDRQYLGFVKSGCERMSQLIDDLLSLSKVARADMHRDRVDLSDLVQTIASALRGQEPSREVELVIAPALVAKADARLLRVALENLLGNALKFTSNCAVATIEFGACEQDDKIVYFVRDNGAGFQMEYANRLFGAFQRLHGEKEFPGTGIGLATVQRIIHRHGGHVWAEGAVDKGATFYFTLG